MHSDDHDSSRRKLIQGAAATFAAGMVLPGFAQAADADATPQAAPAPLRDPKALHPQPPFDKQSQPWPGLARDMQPPPDHGEKSYRGSNRLAGRKALITMCIGGGQGIALLVESILPWTGVIVGLVALRAVLRRRRPGRPGHRSCRSPGPGSG